MAKTRQPTSQEIKVLVAFLPGLHQEGFTPIKLWHTNERTRDGLLIFPWPEYDELVEEFFSAASRDEWLDCNYVPEEAWVMLANDDTVSTATLPQVKAMLTYCVRGERFCDGHWGAMIEGGHIRRLLERLETIGSEVSEELPLASARGERE